MSAIVDLESLEVEGFLSWGAYPTTLKLSDVEQCFVAGRVDGPEGKSNGAGKTSLLMAIVWCLSGKTLTNPNPGDKILNWFTTSDARVKLKFKNGAELTRIRTRSGTTELLYSKDGQVVIDDTLSTTGNQQLWLNNELRFDYEVFCGSLFFSQYRQPWMAMPDPARRQAFERITGVDRLSIYADVAKRKADKAELEQDKLRSKISNLNTTITTLTTQLTTSTEASGKFETSRLERREAKLAEAKNYAAEAATFKEINITRLTQRWDVVDKINTKLSTIETQISELDTNALTIKTKCSIDLDALRTTVAADKKRLQNSADTQKKALRDTLEKARTAKNTSTSSINSQATKLQGKIAEYKGTIKSLETTIKLWESKSGKICTYCEQEVHTDHAASKITEPLKQKTILVGNISDLESQLSKLETQKKQVEKDFATNEAKTTTAISELQRISDQNSQSVDNKLAIDIIAIESVRDTEIETIIANKNKLLELIGSVKARLESSTPETTIPEAKAKNAQLATIIEAASNARRGADQILSEQNTHTSVIEALSIDIEAKRITIKESEKDLCNYDIIFKHLTYIHKSYSDRRKIKSHLISRHKAIFNSRLHHYLDMLDLDIRISLTDTLALDSNLWGYDQQSGGERGRTDLAFMFAVLDLNTSIHGQQSNVLVLDEPEKALDEFGRNVLISIIKDDLSAKFESIFIVSHNNCFFDVFPHQLTIERIDRLSHIVDFR